MTWGIAEVVDREWDVLVIGAGPAGALAARQLAQEGASVLLVEKTAFPRWKVCGCCLNGLALSTLETVGLGALPERLHARPLRQFQLATPKGRVLLPLPVGFAVSREAFDTSLVCEATQAGAQFLSHTTATVCAEMDGVRTVALKHRETEAFARARVVLAADGLSGQSLKDLPDFVFSISRGSRIGVAAAFETTASAYEPEVIHMACGHGGYVGVVQLEDGRIDVAAALDWPAIRSHGKPAKLVAQILVETGFAPPDGLQAAVWRGTPALTRRRTPISAERLFVLGDAAGYVEPFTGEGMAWAMLSATLVAPLALAAIDGWTPELSPQWEHLHRRFLRPRQRIVRVASYLLRRPQLTGILVRVASRLPRLATPVIQAINAPEKQTSLHGMT